MLQKVNKLINNKELSNYSIHRNNNNKESKDTNKIKEMEALKNENDSIIDYGDECEYSVQEDSMELIKNKELIYSSYGTLSEISETIDTIEKNLKSFNVEIINPPNSSQKILIPKAKSEGMINNIDTFSSIIINSDEDIQFTILSITNSLREIQNQTIQEMLESSHYFQPIILSLKSIITYSRRLLKILNIFIEKKNKIKERNKLIKTRSESNILKSIKDDKSKNINKLKNKKIEQSVDEKVSKQKHEAYIHQIGKYKFYKSQINILLEVMESMISSYYTYMEKLEEKEN